MRSLALLPLAFAAAPAFAQDAVPTSEAPVPMPAADLDGEDLTREGDEILVIAGRLKGQIDAPQVPILTLDEAAIASYGVGSIDELLTTLSPETGTGRGRGGGQPVVLLNGQRVASFRELRDIPPEAIRRMEVLPEEVALRYGYPPNQRVVNFILKDNFASKTAAFEYHVPPRGGFADGEIEAGLTRIDGPRRLNLSAKYNDTSSLTEAERNVRQAQDTVPTVPGDPDPAAYRSLIDQYRILKLNGTWSTGLGEGARAGSLSLNGALTRSNVLSLSGLDTVLLTSGGTDVLRTLPGALASRTRTTTLQSGVTFNKPVGGWQLTATVDASHEEIDSRVDRKADTTAIADAVAAGTLSITGPLPALPKAGVDLAESRELTLTSLGTVVGSPFRLPAGAATLTAKGGFAFTRSDSSDTRSLIGDTVLRRGDLSAGINLALPLTSRKDHVLGGIGDITLNLSAGLDRLSDFGTVTDWSGGLTWSPTGKLGLQVSYIVNEAAPTLAQLGGPQITTLNVSVYDFTRSETALVSVVGGGNPDLRRETQRDLKFGANWELPFVKNSNLVVEYFRNNSDDVTQSFPLLTPAIEAAFPDRVIRDGGGQLVSIDRRAITFSKVASSRLRWGFNLAGSLGKAQAVQQDRGIAGMIGPGGLRGPGAGPGVAGPGGGPRPGGGGPGGGGPGGFGRGPMGGGNDGRGRWNIAVYHTYRFTERVVIAPGSPSLDLLGGDAIVDGGVPRHAVEVEGGGFYRGFGLRLNGNWIAPTHVRATGAPGSSDLRFGSVFNVNGRLFVNFEQRRKLVEKVPFLKGARLSLEIDDIFNSRQTVTDPSGQVPLSYQAAFRDPRGRIVGIDFRKLF